MIYREIDPQLYTIDGQGLDGLQELQHADDENIGSRVVAVCAEYNFAVVENTFSATTLKTLQHHASEAIVEHDAANSTLHYNTPKAYRIHKTPERHTAMPDESRALLQGVARGIYRASAESRQLDTPNSGIDVLFVTRYMPGGKATRHYDKTSGVAMETTLGGTVEVTLKVGLRGLARVPLGTNATLILPGETFGSRGHKDQAKHSVRNITPESEHKGCRLGITYIYGRLSPEERAARLHSLGRRGTIR
jgi:hypothetical protein